MTTLLSFTATENINQVDWNELIREVTKVRALPRQERENYFKDVVEKLPQAAAPVFDAYMELVPRFFECREFHEYAKLPYHDPRDENGQIIRVALAGVLGAKFDK